MIKGIPVRFVAVTQIIIKVANFTDEGCQMAQI